MARRPAASQASGRQPQRPVFILAAGRRTGSTLLQRLLISSGEVMVWGEHDGVVVRHLYGLASGMSKWLHSGAGAQAQFAAFRQNGFNEWIPNMNPPMRHVEEGCRAFLDQAFAAPARALGYPRWGFKEVRYGAGAAKFLQALYPDASFLLLVRDPRHCLRSIKAAEWGERVALGDGPLPFLRTWATLGGELHDVAGKLRHAALIRYEDVLGDTGNVVQTIAKVTGVPLAKFKVQDVLGHREGGPGGGNVEFSAEDDVALGDPEVRRVAGLFNYL